MAVGIQPYFAEETEIINLPETNFEFRTAHDVVHAHNVLRFNARND